MRYSIIVLMSIFLIYSCKSITQVQSKSLRIYYIPWDVELRVPYRDIDLFMSSRILKKGINVIKEDSISSLLDSYKSDKRNQIINDLRIICVIDDSFKSDTITINKNLSINFNRTFINKNNILLKQLAKYFPLDLKESIDVEIR